MSGNRPLLVLLPIAAVALAFWLLVLSPKRQEASDLKSEVTDLQAQVDQQQQLVATADAARRDFPRAYRRLVVLGKAAPEDDDTSSLIVQLDRISDRARVKFVSLTNSGGTEAAAPPPPPPPPPASAPEGAEQPVADAEGQPAPPVAPATEAQAALLPIGAAVGPAGLPVMHYELIFEGDFYRLAKFLKGIDGMVKTSDEGGVGVRGRLVTVDGFALEPAVEGFDSNPRLSGQFTITTYLTPADQGITAGASPAGPATTPQPTSAAPPPAEPTATASATAP